MDEKLLTETFSERHEVPDKLKKRIHTKLLKEEKRMILRNIVLTLTAVFVTLFFAITIVVVFVGKIIPLLTTFVLAAIIFFMAVALAAAAGKYEIRNIQKGV